MPVTFAVRLPWGRFHATPWDRNVNEAAVEWPPSPWRLLRAFYATWQERAPWLPEDTVGALLDRLATPPAFLLPPAVEAHTRHYMPDWTSGPPRWNSQKSQFELRRTDKVLDAFAVTERDAELWVRWDADLDGPEREALGVLAERLGYLGRAESLCQARVLDVDGTEDLPPSLRDSAWLHPVGGQVSGRDDHLTVQVLCPAVPLARVSRLSAAGPAVSAVRCGRPAG